MNLNDLYEMKDPRDAYQRDYDSSVSGMNRQSRADVTGEEEPGGIFTVMIDGRSWKTGSSNEMFGIAERVANKYPDKKITVKWPTGQLNTIKPQGMEEGQKWPDRSNSIADRDVVVPNLDAYRRGETGGSKVGRPGGMTVATRVEPTITSTKVQRKDDRPIPSFLQKGVAEGSEDWATEKEKIRSMSTTQRREYALAKLASTNDDKYAHIAQKAGAGHSEIMNALKGQQSMTEGEGNLSKALDTLSGSWSGWHQVDSYEPDIEKYEWDDGEGGYYAGGSIEHNLQTGEIKVDFADEYNDEIKGTFNSIGDAMNALRGGNPGSHGGKAPNFDRLGQRKQYGPDDLYKSDRVGRKGSLSGGASNALKQSIQANKGRLGPAGVLPEGDSYSVDYAETGEYDYEGDQARDQLNTIVRAARRLNGLLDDNENMPEWVQMKVTLAADYLDTAADYIESNQEPELAEGDRGRGRPPAGEQDTTPVIPGRVEKTATGIRHHADASRYGGTEPDAEDDRLMSKSHISRLGKMTEPDIDEGNRKPEPPEADYGDDYQQMVLRLKKLAGAGPLKTVYHPASRVYRNVPVVVQPKK